MIDEALLDILRTYGSVTIVHLPAVEESMYGSFDESFVMEVQTEHGRVGSGAYVMLSNTATQADDSLDKMAERLTKSVDAWKAEHERWVARNREEAEDWEVEGTWLSPITQSNDTSNTE